MAVCLCLYSMSFQTHVICVITKKKSFITWCNHNHLNQLNIDKIKELVVDDDGSNMDDAAKRLLILKTWILYVHFQISSIEDLYRLMLETSIGHSEFDL